MMNQNISVFTGLGKFGLVLSGAAVMLSLAGCDFAKAQLKPDRSGQLEIQDFRDGLAPRLPDAEEGVADSGAIPGLQPYIASASGNMKPMPLVSLSVNQSVPLKDVLFELAQQADYDLELDPGIRGSIIFTARERPFDQVIERISEIAGLRYKFDDDILRVEMDTPYNKTYRISYLSLIRASSGAVRNNIAVVSGEGADTGSSYEASNENESNFWGELEVNLTQILNGRGTALRTTRDPRITAAEQNPEVATVAPTAATGEEAAVPADGAAPEVQVQAPQAVLNVESLPIEDEVQEGSATGAAQLSGQTFSLNRQSGLISVYANERGHKEVAEYLNKLERAASAQVLIEAKILEVTLNDEFATGIDWRVIDMLSGEIALNYLSEGFGILDSLGPDSAPSLSLPTEAVESSFVVGYAGNDVQAVVQAISGMGAVRALASPRMTVLNNQAAVLNVATNRVYFEIDIDVTVDEGVQQTDISSEINNVPEGILVNVQPSINLDDGTISMAVRPSVTRIVNRIQDPAIQFVTASAGITGVSSEIPEVNVQEIDSVIKVNSGQAVVMGGLLQDRAEMHENGVPGLSEVPMVGALFRQHSDQQQKTELVIFLKATILDTPSASVQDTDKDMYRRFSGDRHPLKL